MSLVTWYDQAALHRDVCIAVLDAYLPHGDAQKLAAAVGVSPQWITYFRQADSFSMPSLGLARRIAAKLHAPRHHCRAFVDHLQAARQAYLRAQREVHVVIHSQLPVVDHIHELDATFYAANFGPSASETRHAYQRALAIGRLLVTQTPPSVYPLEYLTVCCTLLHIHIALDEIPHGLFWVKLGNHVASALPITELASNLQRDRLRHLRYLLARDEALGYHHLGNDKAALQVFDRAEAALGDHPNPRFQGGDLARNRLLALPGTSRFTIGDAEALAMSALPIFEQKDDYLGIVLNGQALARALIRHGNRKSLKRAESILRDLPAQMAQLPNAGPIHRAVVLQTWAELAQLRGDKNEWQAIMRRLLPLAKTAGLVHIQHRLRQEYGQALAAVAQELT